MNPSESEAIIFSIIIPTYSRPERLSHCLEALTKLDYPRDRFEVIVVDDGSKMPLETVVNPFKAVLNLTLLRQANAGPASARNTGARNAQGQFIAFTDDDCSPDPNWLTIAEQALANASECMLGGLTINQLPENRYTSASQLLVDYLYDYYNHDSKNASFFTSNNLIVPTKIFHEFGGFDDSFPLAAGEDREFCDRWSYQGYRLHYCPEIQIYHSHQLTLRTFWKQHFNYGRGAYHFHQIRAKRGQIKIEVEPLSFYVNLINYPLQKAGKSKGIILSLLFMLSQVANTLGFFWEQFHRKERP